MSEFDKALRELEERVLRELDELEKRVREELGRGEGERALRVLKDGVGRVFEELRRGLDELRERAGGVGQEDLRRALEGFKAKVEKKVEELRALAEEAAGGRRAPRFPDFGGLFEAVESAVAAAGEVVEGVVRSLGEAVGPLKRLAPTIVVSARLRERDLEVIDRLVDAGIFKSRSEAIAYFTRKGIEASGEWIKKALEHAEKIRELQKSLRDEVEKYLGERGGE